MDKILILFMNAAKQTPNRIAPFDIVSLDIPLSSHRAMKSLSSLPRLSSLLSTTHHPPHLIPFSRLDAL